MFWAPHTTFNIHSLNYDTLLIFKMPFALIKFNGDVIFELPTFHNSKGHIGQMQGMERKYDGHA
jgi:hypothetical protein